MQALILAAGMGRRLGPHTENKPKCLVEVAGVTLIERVVRSLASANINKIIFVVGYKADILRSYVKNLALDIEVEFVENKEYATTNNIYSLYLARHHLIQSDTILLESDLIFEEDLISRLVVYQEPNVAVVAPYESWMDGTVTTINENGYITAFIEKKDFDIKFSNSYYKTVNIYKFSREFLEVELVPFLEAFVRAYGPNNYYEAVFKMLVQTSQSRISAYVLGAEDWYEIDDAQDLRIAEDMFQKHAGDIDNIQSRYGGYWRFPRLIDFCYLVNPFFPTEEMVTRINLDFSSLLRQYPSGMDVQAFEASRLFDVDEEALLVGNGAAELINALRAVVKGKVGIPIPTFNEYIRCLNQCELSLIDTSLSGYQFDLETFFQRIGGLDWLVIVNPDNPSGAFLTEEELISLASACESKGKGIIVDESFADFVHPDKRFTLLRTDVLRKFKNLVVIKSISKSYGVPGLRLGVLATSNTELLSEIRKSLPVWNINSFAESFLQIMPFYKEAFTQACNLIVTEREWLSARLQEFGWIKPYPSEANYIMCQVKGYSSTEVARELLRQNIYIKDLAGKQGFSSPDYIRIAVRERSDNQRLLDCLATIWEPIIKV